MLDVVVVRPLSPPRVHWYTVHNDMLFDSTSSVTSRLLVVSCLRATDSDRHFSFPLSQSFSCSHFPLIVILSGRPHQLLENLAAGLVYDQPDDPRAYLIAEVIFPLLDSSVCSSKLSLTRVKKTTKKDLMFHHKH